MRGVRPLGGNPPLRRGRRDAPRWPSHGRAPERRAPRKQPGRRGEPPAPAPARFPHSSCCGPSRERLISVGGPSTQTRASELRERYETASETHRHGIRRVALSDKCARPWSRDDSVTSEAVKWSEAKPARQAERAPTCQARVKFGELESELIPAAIQSGFRGGGGTPRVRSTRACVTPGAGP